MIADAKSNSNPFFKMPANLTHKFRVAEQAYRNAQTPREELECLQQMLIDLPKHKGTDRMQADLKQKISRAKKELSNSVSSSKQIIARIPRQGAGRAIIIGGPNAGKSQLLASLTRATPEIAPYPFTTRDPSPGMMPWEDVYVQLIDTPPIGTDTYDPRVQSLIRGADLVILMLDLGSDDGGDELKALLAEIQKTKTRLGQETCIDENDIGVTYTQTYLVPNKIDLPESTDRAEFFREVIQTEFEAYPVSAAKGQGISELRNAIYAAMDVVRIYTKHPNQKDPDRDKPFTIARGGTILDVAELIHRDFATQFKSARVWGAKVHDGTTVKADYVPEDKDIVELHV